MVTNCAHLVKQEYELMAKQVMTEPTARGFYDVFVEARIGLNPNHSAKNEAARVRGLLQDMQAVARYFKRYTWPDSADILLPRRSQIFVKPDRELAYTWQTINTKEMAFALNYYRLYTPETLRALIEAYLAVYAVMPEIDEYGYDRATADAQRAAAKDAVNAAGKAFTALWSK